MRPWRILVLVLALTTAAPLLKAQADEGPLRARLVAAIARDAGIQPRDDWKLLLPVSGIRVPAQSALHLAKGSPHGDQTWLLRFECGSRQECLPFEVLLEAPGLERKITMPAVSAAEATASQAVTSPGLGPHRQTVAPAVRAGERVRLSERVSGLRLSVPAICLQAGAVGQKIRVRNAATRKVIEAKVFGKGEVVVEE